MTAPQAGRRARRASSAAIARLVVFDRMNLGRLGKPQGERTAAGKQIGHALGAFGRPR